MKKWKMFLKTEKPAKVYMMSISIIGWLYVAVQVFYIEEWRDPLIYVLLIIFLAVCEVYPMPVWKGFTSIGFPIVFVLYFVFGLPIAMISYALVIFFVNIIDHRPLRIACFNPAQLVLSFSASASLAQLLVPFIIKDGSVTLSHMTELVILAIFFYILNNLIVDLVLLIRPHPYPLHIWKQKLVSELNSGAISVLYGGLFLLLGSQNRGQIDVFSFFFFFSPLVGLALLSSVIVRLKKEKSRLNALFSLTSKLNKMVPTKEWVDSLKSNFHELIDVEGILLWTNEKGRWKTSYEEGRVNFGTPLREETITVFEQMEKPLTIANNKKEMVPAQECFHSALRSFVFAPLVIENETVGIFVVARSRTKSFTHGEVQSIATLSNQLAVIIKTRVLILEKEKRTLLEERNRIARDIHDGIAQTLAAALMKLETAQRKWEKNPEESMYLVTDSMEKIRSSLKQVRQSIYALRPNPTERVGLQTAIKQKMHAFEQETGLHFSFEERGKAETLSTMVEKVLFETFQESIQNIVKHAKATKVETLVSYQKEHIILKVKDDGVGFSLLEAMMKAQKEPHFGILQMNDAAEKIGSSLQINSKPGKGTEIVMTVPKMGIEGGTEDDSTYASG
ncbi:GAF domain-containing sensor histidine kinase [Bacillus fonticola]|uniref:GAF domain-containing sensor histidine kinase n=1 Tax=Bacillus fonticola TaxID=2728853 RepID=UPI001473A510|nr:GAF domain-containing sensor histidine kinase [Bacillus fonticola]